MIDTELMRLVKTVQAFGVQMYSKLADKVEQGYTGWDDESYIRNLEEKLMEHTQQLINGDGKQAVDVANLAMFLWRLRERIAEKRLENIRAALAEQKEKG